MSVTYQLIVCHWNTRRRHLKRKGKAVSDIVSTLPLKREGIET